MQKEYSGFGSINNLKDIISNYYPKSIFLVTGKNSYKSCGAEKALSTLLERFNVIKFSDFTENPKIEDLEKGIKIFKESHCDVVVAIGGGSVIDAAKIINVMAAQTGKPLAYILDEKKIEAKGKPLIAIPTTAGTGSEATHFAVVYVAKTKYSVEHNNLLPEYSILDPTFIMKLPKYITASTGMDALSQAIESYWSINSTPESRKYAEQAIKLITKNIVVAANNPTFESREAMLLGANLAGKAINITKTTAPHAISYTLTSHFGISHGHAVALTLGEVYVYNSEVAQENVVDKRGAAYVKQRIKELNKMLDCDDAYSSRKKLENIMHEIGLKTHLSELGVKTKDHIKLIIDNVNVKRLINNPRKITTESLITILENIRYNAEHK